MYSYHVSIIYMISFIFVDCILLKHYATRPQIHSNALCLRGVYDFNCFESRMWLFEFIFSFQKKLKKEELTEKDHCVWSVSYAACTKRPKEIVHQVNVFVQSTVYRSIYCGSSKQCRLHISLIFEHFRNHFISVLVQSLFGLLFISMVSISMSVFVHHSPHCGCVCVCAHLHQSTSNKFHIIHLLRRTSTFIILFLST